MTAEFRAAVGPNAMAGWRREAELELVLAGLH